MKSYLTDAEMSKEDARLSREQLACLARIDAALDELDEILADA